MPLGKQSPNALSANLKLSLLQTPLKAHTECTKEPGSYPICFPKSPEGRKKRMEKRCCCSRGHSLEQVPAASKGRGGLGSQFSILYKGGRNLQEGLPNYKAPLSPVGLALTVTQRPRLTCRREGLGLRPLTCCVYPPQLERSGWRCRRHFSEQPPSL